MAEILTEEDYTEILKSKLESKEVVYISSEWKSLDNVEGFMGDHFFLKINYTINNEQKAENFFIKTKPTKTEIQLTTVSKHNIYEKEIFVYNFLLKEFEKMGYPTNFAPKSYYVKNGETIVLENMHLRNFELIERGKFYDLEHCKVALKALANYHSNCISYEEEKSKETGKPYALNENRDSLFNEVFFILGGKENEGTKYIQKTLDVYLELSKIMPVSEEWKKSFEKKIKKFDCPKIFWQDFPYRKTVCHGDLWSNNMMFQYENGVPTECCLLDFQLIRYHYPSYDAMLVIYSNTTREFRKNNMKYLLDYYYDTFESFLDQNGYKVSTIFPKEHFLEVAEAIKSVALFQGAATRTLTLLPKNITTDAVNYGGDNLENLFFKDERTKLLLEGCKKDEILKKIMFDDIYALNDIL